MQKFTVQLLTDEEYDSLPYSKAKKSFGCADPDKGLAFVRKTGIPLMDIGTLTHEVNHLMEKHGNEKPDLDGIYYKSNSNFFSGGGLGGILGDVAGVVAAPFTGGASLGFLPLLSAAGGAIQGGIQGGGGGILGGALKGLGFGGAAAGLGGGLLGGIEGASGGLGSALSGAGSGFGSGLNTFVSGIPGFGQGGALNAATGFGGASFAPGAAGTTAEGLLGSPAGTAIGANSPAMSLIGGGQGNTAGSLVTPAGIGTSGATGAGAASSGGGLSSLIKNPGLLTLGAGLLGASALAPTPSFQLPPQISALESQLQSGQPLTPLGQSAQSSLQNIINTPPSSLDPALAANDPYFASTFQQMDTDFANAKAQLDASFNASGQLGSGEYQTQLAQLTENYQNAKDQTVAQENQQRYLAGQQEQLTAIQQATGLDSQETQDLLGLYGLDVQAAATKYGVDAATVQQLRSVLGTVAGSAISGGLGLNSSGTTIKIGS